MARIMTDGGRVAHRGAGVVPTERAGIVALVSMVKFLRLLKILVAKYQNPMTTATGNRRGSGLMMNL